MQTDIEICCLSWIIKRMPFIFLFINFNWLSKQTTREDFIGGKAQIFFLTRGDCIAQAFSSFSNHLNFSLSYFLQLLYFLLQNHVSHKSVPIAIARHIKSKLMDLPSTWSFSGSNRGKPAILLSEKHYINNIYIKIIDIK